MKAKKVKINFTASDIEQLQDDLMHAEETNEKVEVFLWTPFTDDGIPIELTITVGSDDEDEEPYDEDTIDEIIGECPECRGDGVVSVGYEDEKGRDMEKEVRCKNDWHNE